MLIKPRIMPVTLMATPPRTLGRLARRMPTMPMMIAAIAASGVRIVNRLTKGVKAITTTPGKAISPSTNAVTAMELRRALVGLWDSPEGCRKGPPCGPWPAPGCCVDAPAPWSSPGGGGGGNGGVALIGLPGGLALWVRHAGGHRWHGLEGHRPRWALSPGPGILPGIVARVETPVTGRAGGSVASISAPTLSSTHSLGSPPPRQSWRRSFCAEGMPLTSCSWSLRSPWPRRRLGVELS
jgi:hypothetical protein